MSIPANPAESSDKKPGILQEPWMRGVAITTTVLAVLTAIVSARSAHCIARTQLLTSEEGIRWTYYNSKALNVQMLKMERDLLAAQEFAAVFPAQQKLLKDKVAEHDRNILIGESQQEIIEKKAMEFRAKKESVGKQGNWFTLSAVFFQIAIMLSSVSALLHRKFMWLIGLFFGVVAIACFANAFFLFYNGVDPVTLAKNLFRLS